MPPINRLLAAVLIPMAICRVSTAQVPRAEREALIALYNATSGATWHQRDNWLGPPGTEGTWYGVALNETGDSVQAIALLGNNLSGSVPSLLGDLPNLVNLNLARNQLLGAIPPEICNLERLSYLLLSDNDLTGTIPDCIGDIDLLRLDLGHNALSGPLPLALGNLHHLSLLDLQHNSLTGTIPPGLGENTCCGMELYLNDNELSGAIPPELGRAYNTVAVNLSHNHLSGSLPSEIGGLGTSLLVIFDLSYNDLEGPLPEGLFDLREISGTLDLSHNRFSGEILNYFGGFQSAERINLSHNEFSGTFPSSLLTCPSLESLDLSHNQLEGTLPSGIGSPSSLAVLKLSGNMFFGEIPSSITALASILPGWLDLSYNQLYSTDPDVIAFLDAHHVNPPHWSATQTVTPRDLHVSSTTGWTIAVEWTPLASTDGPLEYWVGYRKTGDEAGWQGAYVGDESVSSYTVDGLLRSTSYEFTMRAEAPPHAENGNFLSGVLAAVVTAETTACNLVCSAGYSGDIGTPPTTVLFDAMVDAVDCQGVPVVLWSFGDGDVSSEEDPVHTYEEPGEYPWTFSVTGVPDGRPCLLSGVITVFDPNACGMEWQISEELPEWAGFMLDLRYADGLFWAGGFFGEILWSGDGFSWNHVTVEEADFINGIAMNQGRIVAVDARGGIFWADSLDRWNSADVEGVSAFFDVLYDGRRYIAVGSGGALATSNTGECWDVLELEGAGNLWGIATNGSVYVVVGDGGALYVGADPTALVRRDLGDDVNLFDVDFGECKFVVVGDRWTILTSPDGAEWTQTGGLIGGHSYRAVDHGAGGFVAVGAGEDDQIAYSPNAEMWLSRTSGTRYGLEDVEFGADRAVAVGQGGRSVVAVCDPLEQDSCTCAVDGGQSLCLAGRFRVNVRWRDHDGKWGFGRSAAVTEDTGYFWFFNESNVELMIKVLDGSALNGHYWVFYGALSDVEYTITVTDTSTGFSATYFNPAHNLASVADVEALPGEASAPQQRAVKVREPDDRGSTLVVDEPFVRSNQTAAPAGSGECTPGGTVLCLSNNRFRVECSWRSYADGSTGSGQAVAISDDTGYSWFFGSSNVELVVKVLDGTAINGNFWVFYGALSDVEYTITVTDTKTLRSRSYYNPPHELASVADTAAFATP